MNYEIEINDALGGMHPTPGDRPGGAVYYRRVGGGPVEVRRHRSTQEIKAVISSGADSANMTAEGEVSVSPVRRGGELSSQTASSIVVPDVALAEPSDLGAFVG